MDPTRRDLKVDCLRTLGLLSIMLAHVSPPATLFQLRTFDVPMMIFLSGMSYAIAKKSTVSYGQYLWSRFQRLVIPVWIFLTIFLYSIKLFNITIFEFPIDKQKIIESYFLYNGIGYVWIMGIFLLIAIFSPLYKSLAERSSNNMLGLSALSCIVIISLIIDPLQSYSFGYWITLVYNLSISILSYGIMFIFGYQYSSLVKREKFFILATSLLLIFFIESVSYHFEKTIITPQSTKYPPHSVYIFYSIFIIIIMNEGLAKLMPLNNKKVTMLVTFVSSNTVWIYLLHIPIVEYMKHASHNMFFLTKWLIAVIMSVTLYYLQRKWVLLLTMKIKNPKIAKFLIKSLTG
ncbi:acyltransferase family protein [Martelella alba]|uniref:Acyltransferase n=1 Tax=Martelella alba TaxID=2590451 RepID=A0ABY2SKU4_9HYPH|nr:acyltransferase [Martelella alba]TKI05754.1 acyltransferase [Martelella alba]